MTYEPYISVLTKTQAFDWGMRFIGRPLVNGDWFCGGKVVITDTISMEKS